MVVVVLSAAAMIYSPCLFLKLDLHLFVYEKATLAAMCSAEVIIDLIRLENNHALESQVDYVGPVQACKLS